MHRNEEAGQKKKFYIPFFFNTYICYKYILLLLGWHTEQWHHIHGNSSLKTKVVVVVVVVFSCSCSCSCSCCSCSCSWLCCCSCWCCSDIQESFWRGMNWLASKEIQSTRHRLIDWLIHYCLHLIIFNLNPKLRGDCFRFVIEKLCIFKNNVNNLSIFVF